MNFKLRNNFHGENKKFSFFEGWYLKHQSALNTIAFIPAFHIDKAGRSSSSIQVIMNNKSFSIDFPEYSFVADKKRFYVKVGDNLFCEKGIRIFLKTDDITIKGKIYYSPFTMLQSDIMGPFRFFPIMQCNHGVLSLKHKLSGSLMINGENVDFTGGIGYIEKDWGSSFPKSYLWTQCNQFDKIQCSIMLSIAHIPFMGIDFTGCICTIYYEGKEYRLATYLGVRILKYSSHEVIISQNKYLLRVCFLNEKPHKLNAPNLGEMTRTVHESLVSKVQYKFYVNSKILFNLTSNYASFEENH
ncbi:MAG: hypothetical protein GX913_07680 [Clostridiales bacterium]|nr:hypothetical protein [Clostridiales bacterium]